MKLLHKTLLAGLLGLPLLAQAADYQVVSSASQLKFHGTYQGAGFDGQFPHWKASIRYDPQHLELSSFDVEISLAAAATGDSNRDQSLPTADFFDVAHFPTAHFTTQKFHRAADGSVLADGTLQLKGHTHPVELSVHFVPSAQGATLDVSTQLKRLDYGVGSGDYADTSVIGNEVGVSAHLQLTTK
ncbi:YceI family protein [Frateuria aurantia]